MNWEWRQRVFCVALLFVCSVALVVVGAYILWIDHVNTIQLDGFSYVLHELCTNIGKGMLAASVFGVPLTAAAIDWMAKKRREEAHSPTGKHLFRVTLATIAVMLLLPAAVTA